MPARFTAFTWIRFVADQPGIPVVRNEESDNVWDRINLQWALTTSTRDANAPSAKAMF